MTNKPISKNNLLIYQTKINTCIYIYIISSFKLQLLYIQPRAK